MKPTMKLALAMCCLLLSSCFLSQENPGNKEQAGKKPSAEGVVIMEDFQGVANGGIMMAMFGKKAAASRMLTRVAEEVSDEFPAVGFDWMPVKAEARETRCKLGKGPKQKRRAENRDGLVSAGKVGFGPITASTMTLLDEDKNHRYTKTVPPNFGAGLYRVAAEGSGDVPAFKDILSAPEAIVGLQVNGTAADDKPVITKAGGADISWTPTAIFNDSNLMLIDLFADTETETYQLHCQALEKDFYSPYDAPLHWNFPAKAFAQIPATETAQVYLMRAHARGEKNANPDVEFQGVRTYILNVSLRN